MSRFTRSLSVLAIATIAGCSQQSTEGFGFVARQDTNFSTEAPQYDVAQLTEQTASLEILMRDIVRKSTRKGMVTGAAVGCGLVVLSASNAKNCVAGALVSGAAGAAIGHAAGKKEVARRVELVSANSLTKSIRKTNDQMDSIAIDLPHTLAAQDIELAALARQRDRGEISQATYQARLDAVRADRRALTEALSLTAAQANLATANLETAASRGQTGLDWHLSATKQLARNVESARSQITLF